MIVTAAYDDVAVVVPESARTLDGFREWAASDAFPERGKVTYFQQDLVIDMSPERVDSHNQVKAEVNGVIGPLVKRLDLGQFYPDGLWITNDEADLSTEADGTFATWESLESGRIQLMSGDRGAGIEMRGSPDWTMEIVSNSSVHKDMVLLKDAYHRANVREYWLIDARGHELVLTVFQWQPDGFVAVEPAGGWVNSEVFGHEFHLERTRNRIGGWSYTLHVREANPSP